MARSMTDFLFKPSFGHEATDGLIDYGYRYEYSNNINSKLQLTPVDRPVKCLSKIYETNEGLAQVSLHLSIGKEKTSVVAPVKLCAIIGSILMGVRT